MKLRRRSLWHSYTIGNYWPYFFLSPLQQGFKGKLPAEERETQLEILTKRLVLALQALGEGLITMDLLYVARDDLTQGKKGHLFAMLEYHQQRSMLQALIGK